MSKRKSRGAVWWLLMAVSVVTLALIWVVVRIGSVLEWLQWGPVPEAARNDATGTQDDDVHPGEPRVYRSMDERRDT